MSTALRRLKTARTTRTTGSTEPPDGVRRALVANTSGDEPTGPGADRTRPFALAAHELCSHMTPLFLQVDLLRSDRLGRLTPRQMDAVDQISSSLEQTLHLLQDLLDVSRLHAGRFTIHPVETELGTLLDQVATTFSEQAQRAEVTLGVDLCGPVPLCADPQRIHQVIANLVTNALKFTPPGGSVTLSARAEGDAVAFSVADTGQGIPAEDLPHLFEPYYQVPGHGPSRGNGLGLHICVGIVAAHRGEIKAQSAGVGHGATFTVRLPKR